MNKKKLLALLMALVMTLTLVPVTVIAEELETVTPIAEPTEAVAVESVSFEAMNAVDNTHVAKIGETGYATLDEAVEAAGKGDTITLLSDVTFGENHTVAIWEKAFNLDLGGKTFTTNSTKSITLSNNGYEATAICYGDYKTVNLARYITVSNGTIRTAYGAGIYADGAVTMTLSGLDVKQNYPTNVQTTDEYSSAVRLTSRATVIINDGSYTGKNAIAVSNSGGKITINDGTFTGDIFFSKGINDGLTVADKKITINGGTFDGKFVNTDKGTLVIKGGTFNDDPSSYVPDSGYNVTQNGNTWTVSAKNYVAQVNEGTKYETLKEAIAAATDGDTIKLLEDIDTTTSEPSDLYLKQNSAYRIPISKSLIIDGQNHAVKVKSYGFGVGVGASSNINVTFQNVTIENNSNGARCIDTRGNLNSLTLNNVTLSTDHGGGQYTQPLTIGGSQSTAATINITNSTIQTNDDATAYYAIITFNPVNMTITDSTIKGWACIYAKAASSSAGSAGSVFTISGSKLYSNNVYGGDTNDFAAIMIEDNDVTVDITNTTIDIETTKGSYQGITGFKQGGGTADSVVNLGNGNTVTLSGNKARITLTSGNYNGYQNYGKIAISGGIFNREIYDNLCADGYAPIDNTDPDTKVPYPYTVGKIQVTENATATITTDQSSSVDDTALADVVSDTDARTAITEKTVVSGVQLTNNLTVEENTTSGVQAVVNAAKSNENFSTKLSTASKVEIKVDVKVTPETFVANQTATFDLTPFATVKTYDNEADPDPSSTVTDIPVDNDWIDQSQPITVQLYTGFEPAQIIHRDDNDEIIEVFNTGAFIYNEETKVATVTIHHFSELEATAEATVPTVSFKGASLRRRVLTGTNDVVNTSSDIRFTYEWTIPQGLNLVTGPDKSYFEWRVAGQQNEWKRVNIEHYDGNYASLVIEGVPSAAFETVIETKVHLQFSNGNTIELQGSSRTVKQVATALAGLTDTTKYAEWIDYGNFLVGTGNIQYYTLERDGEGTITGYHTNLSN